MGTQYLLETGGAYELLSADKLRKHLEAAKPFDYIYRLTPNRSPQQLLVWRLGNGVWMVTDTYRNVLEI